MRETYRLDVIKDFRQLGFSMKRIKEYPHDKNMDSTPIVLDEEQVTHEAKTQDAFDERRQ